MIASELDDVPVIGALKVTVLPLLPQTWSCVPPASAIVVLAPKERLPLTGLISALLLPEVSLSVSVWPLLRLKVWRNEESFSICGKTGDAPPKSKRLKPLPVMVKDVLDALFSKMILCPA